MKFRALVLLLLLVLVVLPCLHAQFDYEPAWQNRQTGQPIRIYRLDYNMGQWDSTESAIFTYLPGTTDYTSIGYTYYQGQWQTSYRHVAEFDNAGRLLNLWQQWDSAGIWRPYDSKHYTYDVHGIETSYLWLTQYLGNNDTVTARRTAITYGLGNLPVEAAREHWTSFSGWGPDETRQYHYNGLMEQDTMWLIYPNISLIPRETHIFDGWHDFSQRLTDSITVYETGALPGTFLSIKTTYNGNTPAQYRNWQWVNGSLQSRRFLNLDANGYYELDSTHYYVGQGGPGNCSRWENPVNLQGKRVEERIFGFDTTGYYPRLTMIYQYDTMLVSAGDALPLDLQVWPNPASEVLKLNITSLGNLQVQLIDLRGCLRMALEQPAAKGEVSLPLPPTLESGTYLLHVHVDGRTATRKIIIQR